MTKKGRPSKKKTFEINRQYDMDTLVGEDWKRQFPEILNKRYADGWKYIPSYIRVGIHGKEWDEKLNQEIIVYKYGVLYERRNDTSISTAS